MVTTAMPPGASAAARFSTTRGGRAVCSITSVQRTKSNCPARSSSSAFATRNSIVRSSDSTPKAASAFAICPASMSIPSMLRNPKSERIFE